MENTPKSLSNVSADVLAKFAKQSEFERSIRTSERHLAEARMELNNFNAEAHKEIIDLLDGGYTSGDALTDEVLRWRGFDKSILEKIQAFNEKLMAAKGEKMLVHFSFEKQTIFGGPGSSLGLVDCAYFVLGILSGERLKIVVNPKHDLAVSELSVSIPFFRYVVFDDRLEGPIIGQLVVEGMCSLESISATDILFTITDEFPVKSNKSKLFVGRELQGASPHILYNGAYAEAGKLLYMPTEEEKVAGHGI